MAKPFVPDELWEIIQSPLPSHKPRRFRYPGRKPISDRQALSGILFVLKTGIPWEDLPVEMGCGCGITCWRRLPKMLLQRVDDADCIDWSRIAVDSIIPQAFGGGQGSGKNPPDCSRPKVKQHEVVDAQGIALAGDVTLANQPDATELMPLDEDDQPQQLPEELYGDRADYSEPHREELRKRGIESKLRFVSQKCDEMKVAFFNLAQALI